MLFDSNILLQILYPTKFITVMQNKQEYNFAFRAAS